MWDVGANIGHYTGLFAERVGIEGCVFAFEPSLINHARLVGDCGKLPNVCILHIGLGAIDGKVAFHQGTDELGATSHVASHSEEGQMKIDIRAGDSLVEDGTAIMPNAIKIDVEGFEPEVMEGLVNSLGDRQLRVIGIEMHFGILQERDLADAPRSIEILLVNHGFEIFWTDSSHILAVRT